MRAHTERFQPTRRAAATTTCKLSFILGNFKQNSFLCNIFVHLLHSEYKRSRHSCGEMLGNRMMRGQCSIVILNITCLGNVRNVYVLRVVLLDVKRYL